MSAGGKRTGAHELLEADHLGPESCRADLGPLQFRLGRQGRVRIYLETDDIEPVSISLNERSPHPCKRIQNPMVRLAIDRQVFGQTIIYELGRKTGNPGDPAMNGKLSVSDERRVPESTAYTRRRIE